MSETVSGKQLSKRIYQRQIPVYIVSLIAGIFIVEYFISYSPLTVVKSELTLWSTVIYSFSLLYGFVVLIMGQVRTLARVRESKRIRNSIICVGAIIFFYALGYVFSMFRGSTLLVAIWPTFYDIGVWIETVLATSVIRAFVTAAAVGTIVLTIRGLVGREPGLIELEM